MLSHLYACQIMVTASYFKTIVWDASRTCSSRHKGIEKSFLNVIESIVFNQLRFNLISTSFSFKNFAILNILLYVFIHANLPQSKKLKNTVTELTYFPSLFNFFSSFLNKDSLSTSSFDGVSMDSSLAGNSLVLEYSCGVSSTFESRANSKLVSSYSKHIKFTCTEVMFAMLVTKLSNAFCYLLV